MDSHRAQSAIRRLEQLCAGECDFRTLQLKSAEVIRSAVPFHIGVQASVDPASMLDTTCVPIGIEPDLEREKYVMWLEYAGDDPLTYREVAARPARAAALRLEIEDPRTVRRFVELIEPGGGHDELRAMFVVDGLCWGGLTLYRTADLPDFSAEEVGFFTTISPIMGRGLRQAFLRAAIADPARLADPPGHVLVASSGDVISTSDAAERWLHTLDGNGSLPTVFRSLGAEVSRTRVAQATVVGSAGPLALYASAAKGIEDAVAVIIERPRPVHLTGIIVAAYGLTGRERQVTEAVLQGRLTKQIARDLGISDYTVQDHLKSIFAKVDVGTRGELAHALYTRHYLPPTMNGCTPSPYGYYLDAPVP